MIPNKKHQIFADEYVLTSDAIKAYQKDIDSILSNLQNGSRKIDKSIPQRGYYIYGIFKIIKTQKKRSYAKRR